MINFVLCFIATFAGGFVQTVTGFGSVIVMMFLFPLFLSIVDGAAVGASVSLAGQLFMVLRYWKHVRWKKTILPLIPCVILTTLALYLAPKVDVTKLKAAFGIFLLVLAVYFIYFSSRMKVSASNGSALVCGSLCGIGSGFFGIGSPPMAMYYLAVFGDDKYGYLATTQAFYTLSCIYGVCARIASGILNMSLAGYIGTGIAGFLGGCLLGTRVIDRLDPQMLRKIIYAFLIFVGIYTFAANVL